MESNDLTFLNTVGRYYWPKIQSKTFCNNNVLANCSEKLSYFTRKAIHRIVSCSSFVCTKLMTKTMHSWLTVFVGGVWLNEYIAIQHYKWMISLSPSETMRLHLHDLLEFSEELRPQNKDLFASLIFKQFTELSHVPALSVLNWWQKRCILGWQCTRTCLLA